MKYVLLQNTFRNFSKIHIVVFKLKKNTYLYMYVTDSKFPRLLEFCLSWTSFHVHCTYMTSLTLLLPYCRCIINCKEKLAVTSRMNVLAECMDCTPSEFPTYRWTLEENVNGIWTPIDLSLKTANGKFIIPNFNVACFCFF